MQTHFQTSLGFLIMGGNNNFKVQKNEASAKVSSLGILSPHGSFLSHVFCMLITQLFAG